MIRKDTKRIFNFFYKKVKYPSFQILFKKPAIILIPIALCFLPLKEKGELVKTYMDSFFTNYYYKYIPDYKIRMPVRFSVHGIDVSRYQKEINWDEVKKTKNLKINIGFIFMKATQGSSSVDPYFAKNWNKAKYCGIMRGAYHYFKPNISGETQAMLFLNTVKYEPGDLPPVVDVEEVRKNLKGLRSLKKNLNQWLMIVEETLGKKPIIYTGYKFYKDYLASDFAEYPYWIARYYKPELDLDKKTSWMFWQHSDSGKVKGIESNVDFNVFNGTLKDLEEFCFREEDIVMPD